MAGINFNGLGSGIDFGQLTESILAERSRPMLQLQNKSTGISQRADALKSLNGLLATLTTAADALKNREIGTARTAASTDSSVATASATSAAVIAKTDLNVTRLATNFTQTSRSFAARTEAVLAGGATTATFELRMGGATTGTAITINATNNSLDGLSQAINGANAGITASVVDITGAGSFQLVLQSTDTGTASRVELVETTAVDTGTVTGLNLSRINAPGGTLPGDFGYLDSQVSLNGLTITRSTNQISNAITGVTYNLHKVGATSVNVNSASDIPVKLQSFVSAYNAVQDFMVSQYKKDGKGKPTGVLAGDPTLRSIQTQLREAAGNATTSAATGSTLSNLSQIGIGRDNDGRLTLDRVVLDDRLRVTAGGSNKAVSSDTSRVTTTLTGGTPLAGTVSVDTTRLATAYAESSASSPPSSPVLANPLTPATFQLQLNGTTTGPTFQISAGNDSLVGLRDAINAASGGAVASIVNNGVTDKLVLTSSLTGAANRVQLVEVTVPSTGTGSSLGITASSAGGSADYTQLNAQATINGQVLSSSTNTFSNAVAGVSLNVLGLGAASVAVSISALKSGADDIRALLAGTTETQTGLANSIHTTMNGLSDTINGVVQTAITGYQDSIKTIDKSIAAQADRLVRLRSSLTRQFAAADAAIGQLNGQGTALDGIIKSLQPRSN